MDYASRTDRELVPGAAYRFGVVTASNDAAARTALASRGWLVRSLSPLSEDAARTVRVFTAGASGQALQVVATWEGERDFLPLADSVFAYGPLEMQMEGPPAPDHSGSSPWWGVLGVALGGGLAWWLLTRRG